VKWTANTKNVMESVQPVAVIFSYFIPASQPKVFFISGEASVGIKEVIYFSRKKHFLTRAHQS